MKGCRFKLVIRTKEKCFEQPLQETRAYTVGRDATQDIRLGDDELVSSSHVRLEFSGENWMIEDLGSTNGTFMDGFPLRGKAALLPSGRLSIGNTSLEIRPLEETIPGDLASKHAGIAPGPGPLPDVTPKGANYRFVKEIARGGMGEVHYAEDTNLKRAIAIKKLLRGAKRHSPQKIERFIHEAQTLGKLEHPNIVPIHELGMDAHGEVFYSMKFVKGTTLEEILRRIKDGHKETIAAYLLDRLLTDHDVLRFEVTMENALGMCVGHRIANLLEYGCAPHLGAALRRT